MAAIGQEPERETASFSTLSLQETAFLRGPLTSHGHKRHHQRSRRCPGDLKLYILEPCSQNTDTETNVDATETRRGIIEPSGCVHVRRVGVP